MENPVCSKTSVIKKLAIIISTILKSDTPPQKNGKVIAHT